MNVSSSRNRRRAVWLAAGVSVVIGAGCAGQEELPDAEMSRAQARIDQAQQAGAVEAAGVELDTARRNLREARDRANDGETIEARRYAVRAELDAELAEAKARRFQSEKAADEVKASTETLRDEAQRTAPPPAMPPRSSTAPQSAPGMGVQP